MNNSGWHIRSLVLRLFSSLLKLYPARFRREFSSEIQEVVLSRVRNAEDLGWTTWLSAVFHEIGGLVLSIIQEYWHELRYQKERVMVPALQLQGDRLRKTIAYIRWADPPVWQATLANSLPLWLLSLAMLPSLPFSAAIGYIIFLLFSAVIVFLLWLGWFTPELILYSFFLIIPVGLFDEMSARYETYFILLCALTLMIGIFGYQLSLHKDILGLGWLILLVAVVGMWMLASHANQNYWEMVSALGYGCAPDMPDCAPLPDSTTPWWVLFFRP